MAVNKNALIRYKTIDKCLQNKYRQWTLEDLIDACSDALYEYEGIDKGVSRRTVQSDIQIMRSDKLGYNAPIIVVDKKYYTYEDPDYSITNIPVTEQDLSKMTEVVEFLKQFQGFSHFRELDAMVQKLEDHVYSQKTKQHPVIEFEKNENLKGISHLDFLYQSIINKKAIKITYQSFKARQANTFDFHPYLLKEFRNRWFVVGCKKKKEGILNLALDRILQVEKSELEFQHNFDFDGSTYFKDAIGVSVNPLMEPQKVKLYLSRKHAPYILTKPLHHSQRVVEEDYYGVTIELNVVHNFELEKEILSYGEEVKVLSPERLRKNIINRIQASKDVYETELTTSGLKRVVAQLENNGTSMLNRVYTQREVRKAKAIIDKHLKAIKKAKHANRDLFTEIPELNTLLFNKNLKSIVKHIDPKAQLVKVIYFDKPPTDNWYVTWHQDLTIEVKNKKAVKGYKGWTKKEDRFGVIPPEDVLKSVFTLRVHLDDTSQKNGGVRVVPGSHKKELSKSEIGVITENSVAMPVDIPEGGVHVMSPLVLHASSKSKSQRRRRILHLEFSSAELPEGLEWALDFKS